MSRILRLFNTIKYLKIIQIYYRLYFLVRRKIRNLVGFKYALFKKSDARLLKFSQYFSFYIKHEKNIFSFIGLTKDFGNQIDWNFSEYGKLWTYNLNYFDFLHKKEDIKIIYDFIDNIDFIKDGLEPYPISLRGINWIKFLSKFSIVDSKINDSLYAQYYILADNLELHLLGNHYLENGFSLLFGAYFYDDDKLYKMSKKILKYELNEQILDDGAHFELSPMYHQIMLYRVLDCINLIKNNKFKNDELLSFLEKKASLMIGWLKNITYKNGDIPLINDSTKHIAPTSAQLFFYADKLNIKAENLPLTSSGYKKIIKKNYECLVDIADIKASYIAGHSHSDTFNFEIYIDEKPFIIDTGISTYENNSTRHKERSNISHNVVEINLKNSSHVWGSFRVGSRAKVDVLCLNDNIIKAVHNGYKDILHTRKWQFLDDRVIVSDRLNKICRAVSRLHFHPSVDIDCIKEKIICNKEIKISQYDYCLSFNKTAKAFVAEVNFDCEVEITIKI
ncbi:heparinase II/III family protein [Campylobacter mucosalis]|uniref:heparinase II/III family protein n=1 Tax=Campylobacter mucosalis TaxID=202 RepID=UPI0014700029|nr:heparinase II/III-family protein [Campylobacter mucosalis]